MKRELYQLSSTLRRHDMRHGYVWLAGLLVAVLFPAVAAEETTTAVPKGGVFETVVACETVPDNPFTDASLQAVFTAPS